MNVVNQGISVHCMVEEGNDDSLEEAAAKIEVGGRGPLRVCIQTYPFFLKFQATQGYRHWIHMKTFQHQQSNHLNHRHHHQTGPRVSVIQVSPLKKQPKTPNVQHYYLNSQTSESLIWRTFEKACLLWLPLMKQLITISAKKLQINKSR